MKRAYERGIKQISMVDVASTRTRKHANKGTRKEKNKQKSKQKMVSARDKFRFGSYVHNFIVLKHGRHTSKQDSCIDM